MRTRSHQKKLTFSYSGNQDQQNKRIRARTRRKSSLGALHGALRNSDSFSIKSYSRLKPDFNEFEQLSLAGDPFTHNAWAFPATEQSCEKHCWAHSSDMRFFVAAISPVQNSGCPLPFRNSRAFTQTLFTFWIRARRIPWPRTSPCCICAVSCGLLQTENNSTFPRLTS